MPAVAATPKLQSRGCRQGAGLSISLRVQHVRRGKQFATDTVYSAGEGPIFSTFLRDHLDGSMASSMKMMHLKCIQAGYLVTDETTRLLLKILDLLGVQLRREKKIYYKNNLTHVKDVSGCKCQSH